MSVTKTIIPPLVPIKPKYKIGYMCYKAKNYLKSVETNENKFSYTGYSKSKDIKYKTDDLCKKKKKEKGYKYTYDSNKMIFTTIAWCFTCDGRIEEVNLDTGEGKIVYPGSEKL